jgi:tryptophan halogenase
VPESLREKMELFRSRGRIQKYREGVFLDASWVAVYVGQGILPEGFDPRAGVPTESLMRGMEALHAEIRETVGTAPEHLAFINRYCAMAAS